MQSTAYFYNSGLQFVKKSFQEMAFILFDFEESNTVPVFKCSGVLPKVANARTTV